jgi:hypothetical protein
MSLAMTIPRDPVRMFITVDKAVRAALKMEAARREVEMSDLAEEILSEALAETLALVRQRQAEQKKKGRNAE